MDPVDAALMRGLMRDEIYDFVGIDPRRSVADLAKFVGISRNAVAQRLRSWRTSGFLSGTAVYVNPQLVGVRFVGQYLVVPDPSIIAEVERRLGRSRDLFLVYVFGSFVGRELMIATLRAVAVDSESTSQDANPSPGSGLIPVTPPFDVSFPSPRVKMTPSDWRMVSVLRSDPDRRGARLAQSLELSPRHVKRRLDRLLDGAAVFFLPTFDLARRKTSVLLVTVFFPEGEDSNRIWGQMRILYPDMVRLNPRVHAELLLPPQPDGVRMGYLGFLLPVRAGQLAGEVTVALRSVPGVRDASASYPVKAFENRDCFDYLIGIARIGTLPGSDSSRSAGRPF